MQTTTTKNCHFIHHSDCSGEIRIVRHTSQPSNVEEGDFTVEFEDLIDFVAEQVAMTRISAIEQMTARELLGLKE